MTSLRACSRPWLIGVLHLPALPGAPGAAIPIEDVARHAVEDALILQDLGFTALMVENFHDVPFPAGDAAPETIASMAVVARAVGEAIRIPLGIQVLRNDALASLGIAVASGASFLRVNVLAGATVTDQGLIQGKADVLLRRRKALGADVMILADVDVKHATSLDRRPLTQRAVDLATRSGADAILVTGNTTGDPVDLEELSAVSAAVDPVPVLAASGTTPDTLRATLGRCAGTIVGSALREKESERINQIRAATYAERIPR